MAVELPAGYVSIPDAMLLAKRTNRNGFIQSMQKIGAYLTISPRKGAIYLETLQRSLQQEWKRKEPITRPSVPCGYVTVTHAATLVGISRQSAYERVKRRPGIALKIGARLYVRPDDIHEKLRRAQQEIMPEVAQSAKVDYEAGRSLEQVAAKFNISKRLIRSVIVSAGGVIRVPGHTRDRSAKSMARRTRAIKTLANLNVEDLLAVIQAAQDRLKEAP